MKKCCFESWESDSTTQMHVTFCQKSNFSIHDSALHSRGSLHPGNDHFSGCDIAQEVRQVRLRKEAERYPTGGLGQKDSGHRKGDKR